MVVALLNTSNRVVKICGQHPTDNFGDVICCWAQALWGALHVRSMKFLFQPEPGVFSSKFAVPWFLSKFNFGLLQQHLTQFFLAT